MPLYGYIFVLNNYTPAQELEYRSCLGKTGVKYVLFGREVGEKCGTPHLQGYMQVNHNNTKRLNEKLPCKKHILALGSWEENYKYSTKGGDYFEAGEPDKELKGAPGKGQRTDLDDVHKSIVDGLSYDEICEKHFSQAAKYSRFIREQVQARDVSAELNSLRSEYASASLRPWQQTVVELVKEDPNPRKIHWIWEEEGNQGKSWMTKYLAAMHKACILNIGKKIDMAYVYSKNPSNLVVFDLSRTTAPGEGKEHFLDGAYSLAEDLKNGMVMSYKYDSGMVLRKTCHVIFFANFPPDLTKWSADRYFITKL